VEPRLDRRLPYSCHESRRELIPRWDVCGEEAAGGAGDGGVNGCDNAGGVAWDVREHIGPVRGRNSGATTPRPQ